VELLADLEQGLLRLETDPDDHELLNTIFRCAHSLKGGSSTFGFPEIASFTHGLETLLDRVRKHEVRIDAGVCSILFDSLDQLRHLLDAASGAKTTAPDPSQLSSRIEATCLRNGQAPEETADLEEQGFGFWQLPKRYRLTFYP